MEFKMDYNLYRQNLKELNLQGSQLMRLVDSHRNNQNYWKKNNKVPKHIEVILELLKELPLDKRLVYLHNNLN
jgi:hypothetical protein